MSPRVLRRGALVALLLTLLTAAPALAHTSLVKSTPAAGAVLPTAPTTVSLTFGEAVTLPANPLQSTGPGGAAWTVGKATIDDATVSFPVSATGPAGPYTMAWQVISDDGDTVKGTVAFTLSAPAATMTTAAPATYAFPTNGRYQLWAQVRRDWQLITIPITVDVAPAGAGA